MATGQPIIAIIGRANVGKSTLFNRMVGQRLAIVEDEPGTTRDRLYGNATWGDRQFTFVDTGGLETMPVTTMAESIKEQIQAAMAEADTILLVCDVRDGLTAADWEVADTLRSAAVPVLVVANKADDPRHDAAAAEFNQLGLGEPVPVSAYHGRNMPELLERLEAVLPAATAPTVVPDLFGVAIVGRPNVGKSMLLNALLGEERAIVSDVPGTTRDSVDTLFRHGDQSLLLIDTAGVRRRGQIKPGIERYAVLRTLRAISRSDASLLVIDASEGVTAQDLHVAGYIRDAYKGMMVLVNKWDLVPPALRQDAAEQVSAKLHFVPYAPVMYISAKLKQGIELILPHAERIWKERQTWVPAEDLAEFLARTTKRHIPPRAGTRQLKIYSLEQVGINPPTFICTANDPDIVHFSYRRYLENSLRESYGFYGSPIRLFFRRRVVRRSGLKVSKEGQGN